MVNNSPQLIMEEIDSIMDELVDKVFADSQYNLVKDGKVDTTALIGSGRIVKDFLHKQVIYDAEHAAPTEYGRIAGIMPPVPPLVKWVWRNKDKLKNAKFPPIKTMKDAQRTAWAIAIGIKKRGIQASPFLRPAYEKNVEEL